MGAVLVEGPKWCGKTTTCEQHAKSVLYVADPDRKEDYLNLAGTKISELLKGAQPRLFDEWQDIPELWDAIRHAVDHNEGVGQFILTGSSVVPEKSKKKIRHSGTGRFGRIRMRPMSLWESGESSGEVSLEALMSASDFEAASARATALDEIAELICRGGWPAAIGKSGRVAMSIARDYFEAVVESDISRADDIPRDPSRVRRLMRSYARMQGTQASLAAIRKDIVANDTASLSEDTIYSYLNALERIFVVENVGAWTPSLRSKDAIRSSETRYFVDPSLAAAALGVGPNDLVNDLPTFGFLFESLAVRDLRVYAQALHGEVRHYLDRSGLECDAVIHLRDGRYGLVEIKTGGKELIEKGAASLVSLSAKINTAVHMAKPAFMMILTAVGDAAYTRPDGIVVCPITCLKP